MASLLGSRDRLRHPGSEQPERFTAMRVGAQPSTFHLRGGCSLFEAISQEMERLNAGTAMITLDGLRLQNCAFVIPAGPRDETHVAWYSETYEAGAPNFAQAVAVVGWKDGARFIHCHAIWAGDAAHRIKAGMGHIVTQETTISGDQAVNGYVLNGGVLDVKRDPETNFPLFRIVPSEDARATDRTAVLATIRPHEDLRSTLERVASEAGLNDARILGLGSLIGAGFADGTVMDSPLSEILVLDGARIHGGRCTNLPIVCVDPNQATFQGDLLKGEGPICVTCEILLVADDVDGA